MSQIRSKTQQLQGHLRTPLYRNAYALILNTGLSAGLGLVYWAVAARLGESAGEVGHAQALISAMMLISALTQMNFISVFIRFLARAGVQTRKLIVTGYAIAISFGLIAAAVVVALTRQFGDDDNLLYLSGGLTALFVASTAIWSVFSLQDGVLTGLRKSVVVPIENGVYNMLKIVALFPFIAAYGTSTGIFASWTAVTLLTVIPINVYILLRLAPRHAAKTAESQLPVERGKILRYIAGDYPAGLFAQASTTFLPILVFAVLGAEATSYFYFAQVIATVLDRVSMSLSSSLTVEGAGDDTHFAKHARNVLRRGLILNGSAALMVVAFAPWILQIFGSEWRDNATTLLRLLALASIPRVVSMVFGSVARYCHKTQYIAAVTFTQAVILTGGGAMLMNHFGLAGVGYAAIAAQMVIVAVLLPKLLKAIRPGVTEVTL